ncbi:MAG: hypothetical protein AVDCRST_MAG33-3355, partial [uncultured Thermomicrobiales bacterium]
LAFLLADPAGVRIDHEPAALSASICRSDDPH